MSFSSSRLVMLRDGLNGRWQASGRALAVFKRLYNQYRLVAPFADTADLDVAHCHLRALDALRSVQSMVRTATLPIPSAADNLIKRAMQLLEAARYDDAFDSFSKVASHMGQHTNDSKSSPFKDILDVVNKGRLQSGTDADQCRLSVVSPLLIFSNSLHWVNELTRTHFHQLLLLNDDNLVLGCKSQNTLLKLKVRILYMIKITEDCFDRSSGNFHRPCSVGYNLEAMVLPW